MLGRSFAHNNPGPSIFVPAHSPGFCFLLLFLLSTRQPAACPFEEAEIRALCGLSCQLAMPCHRCALPVTQAQSGDELGTVGEGDPESEGLDFRYIEKQQRSLKALEPLTLGKKKLRGMQSMSP